MIKNILLLCFSAVLVLSAINPFTIPSIPLLRSSLGVIMLVATVPALWLGKALIKSSGHTFHMSLTDFAIALFFLSNLLSLAFAPQVFRPSDLRILTVATLFYFFARIFPFRKKDLVQIITVLAFTSVTIALVSSLFLFLPQEISNLARVYFYGDRPFTVIFDYQRGRIAPWGNTLVIFPFFLWFYGLTHKRKTPIAVEHVAFMIGLTVLTLSIVLAGSRWRFFCFLFGIWWTMTHLKQSLNVSQSFIRSSMIVIVLAFFLSSPLTKLKLGYSLWDRFLLTNTDRDITEALDRSQLFERTLLVFSDSPLFGIGTGNVVEFDVGTNRMDLNPPHNILLTVLAETGFIGFLLFGFIVASLWQKFSSSYVRSTPVAIPFLSAISMYLLGGLFESFYANNAILFFSFIGILQKLDEHRYYF